MLKKKRNRREVSADVGPDSQIADEIMISCHPLYLRKKKKKPPPLAETLRHLIKQISIKKKKNIQINDKLFHPMQSGKHLFSDITIKYYLFQSRSKRLGNPLVWGFERAA